MPVGSLRALHWLASQVFCLCGSVGALATRDIEVAHAALRAKGIDLDAKIGRKGTSRPGLFSAKVTVTDPVPPQFCFRDIDGNRFLMVESDQPHDVAEWLLPILASVPGLTKAGWVGEK